MKRIVAFIALIVFMLLAGIVFGESQLLAKREVSTQSPGGRQVINWYHGSSNAGKITVTMGSERMVSDQDEKRDAALPENTELKHFGAGDSLDAEDTHETRTVRNENKHYPPGNRRYETEDETAHDHHDSSDSGHGRHSHEEDDGRHGHEEDDRHEEHSPPAEERPEPIENDPCMH